MRVLLWLLRLPFLALGYLCLVLAILAALRDLWTSVQAERLAFTPLGALWFSVNRDSLNLAQAVVQRYLHPAIWDPGIQWLLLAPAWVSLAILTGVFLLIARLLYRPK